MTRARRILQWWGLDPQQFADANQAWLDPADAEPWDDPRPWLPKAMGVGLGVLVAACLAINVPRAAAQGDDLDFCPIDDPAPASCLTVDGLLLDSDGVVIADLGTAAELTDDGWAIIDGEDAEAPAPAPKTSTPPRVTVDKPTQPQGKGLTGPATDTAAGPATRTSPTTPTGAASTTVDPIAARLRAQLALERRVFRARLHRQTALAGRLRVQLVKERRLHAHQCVIGGAR